MAIDLSAIASPFLPPPELTVERVVDEEGVALWGTFHRYLEHDQRDEPRERLYISLWLAGDQPLRPLPGQVGWRGNLATILLEMVSGDNQFPRIQEEETTGFWYSSRSGSGSWITSVLLRFVRAAYSGNFLKSNHSSGPSVQSVSCGER